VEAWGEVTVALLLLAIQIYTYIVLASVVLSWVPDLRQYAPARWVESVTEPVFAQVRRILPSMGGLDLSPLIVLLALGLLRRLFLAGYG
jgi:YggT family protein